VFRPDGVMGIFSDKRPDFAMLGHGETRGVSGEGHAMSAVGSGELSDRSGAGHWLGLLPMAACVCDGDGVVLHYNPRAAALWGRAPRAGETWETMWQDEPAAAVIGEALRAGRPVTSASIVVAGEAGVHMRLLVNAEPSPGTDTVITFQRCPDTWNDVGGRLRDTLDALPTAVYTADADGHINFYNKAAADLWGVAPAIGTSVRAAPWSLRYPDGSPMPLAECAMTRTIAERQPIRNTEVVLERPDGTRVPIMPYPTPLYDAAGEFVGAVNMLLDITHRKEAEERHTLFARELNHRVKNALATVYAIAMQTMRYTDSIEAFRESFGARLLALSRAHDLLVRSQWQETPLKTVLSDALNAYGAGRLDIEGEEVELGPRATLTMAMTFHELVSNAARYGALSDGKGRVIVRWRAMTDEDGELQVTLEWCEAGGPGVEAPGRTGFGTRLVSHNIMALGGRASFDYPPEGICCTMKFPVIDERSGG
jgi:PAS domain S-box-containing protein